ncbi:UDP-glucuronosyltransferase 2B30-like [Cephus cinctus]|uniref:UDP-glucuronosyltransferase n=1 Tax=Cephus cinctus TaxID=211228 RepID=A0AAJ7CA47_CEPCN|nr:UDP-glucuronosyltransferase 2B30-like [Cephus cinctus]
MKFQYFLMLIGITFLSECPSGDAYRILGLFPLHGKSHFIMCNYLMKTLAARGHQVDVVSHFPLEKPVANYTDINISGSLPQIVNNLPFDVIQQFSSIDLTYLTNIAGLDICRLMDHPEIQKIIRNPPQDPPYDLVIHEMFAAECYLAFGHHLKVPVVGIITSVLFPWLNEPMGNPSNPAFVPSPFSDFQLPMTFWQRVKNVFMENMMTYSFRKNTEIQNEIVKKHFGPDAPTVRELERNISLILVNSHFSFNNPRPLTPAVVEVGGLHLQGDDGLEFSPDLKKWLDEADDGFIFFSLGSMARFETFPREIIEVFYEAFRKVAPVRILMKIAKKEDLPAGVPENTMILPWLPQTKVLKHKNIKAFISHGGLGSVQESLYYGVPLIGMPLFGDQIINIDHCARKKLAVPIDYATVDQKILTEAISTILHDPTYRDNMKKVSKLFQDRPTNPLDLAVYWVEYVIRNGNVLRSPALDLEWWQVALIDVYAFFFSCVAVVVFLIAMILRLLYGKLLAPRSTAGNRDQGKKRQ